MTDFLGGGGGGGGRTEGRSRSKKGEEGGVWGVRVWGGWGWGSRLQCPSHIHTGNNDKEHHHYHHKI